MCTEEKKKAEQFVQEKKEDNQKEDTAYSTYECKY